MTIDTRTAPAAPRDETSSWWRDAAVYQLYPRSFADGNGDGVGDLVGAYERLDYLAELGIDAIWVNPWYTSPMADAGYDVADYRTIDQVFGGLDAAERFVAGAHERGIRVIADIVPNHMSSEHPWFQAALRGEPEYRDRFIFRPGRGSAGDEPPNNWLSNFGGPAWTRLPDGQWYLHLFTPQQPDLNWENPEVRAEFEAVLRFWFDRGLDGFRIDVAHALVKHPELPDAPDVPWGSQHTEAHPAYDQDGVHEIYRSWRRIADSYEPARTFVAEAWVPSPERLARYVRPDGLHTAFQFEFVRSPWRIDFLRSVIDDALRLADTVGAPATWLVANHDLARAVTRYGRSQPAHLVEPDWERARWTLEQPDLELGLRRARAAALLQFALPGTVYIYQGDELGLEEFESIPNEQRSDPIHRMTGGTDPGRDGCRIPLPWSGDAAPYGFTETAATSTWLPQPEGWAPLTVARQLDDPSSTLNLYRTALRLRHSLFGGDEPLQWLDTADGVLAFARGTTQCWINLGATPVDLPADGRIVLRTDPAGPQGTLGVEAAVWLTTQEPS